MRTRGVAARPPARGGAIRRTTRAGPFPGGSAGRPTFAPSGFPYHPVAVARQGLRRGYVTAQCVQALATTYLTAGAVHFGLHTGSRY